MGQAAKTTLFAAANAGAVSKKSLAIFSHSLRAAIPRDELGLGRHGLRCSRDDASNACQSLPDGFGVMHLSQRVAALRQNVLPDEHRDPARRLEQLVARRNDAPVMPEMLHPV